MPKQIDVLCAVLSALIGAWALYKTQTVSKSAMDPILAACMGGESDYELAPYEPLLGGPLVCIMTQFVHRLVRNPPTGLIVWVSTIVTALPVGILMNIEAGRTGAKGLVRYPTFLGFVSILVAVSVSFPLLWVPGFLLLGGSKTGAVMPKRAYASLYLSIPMAVFSYFAFAIDPNSYEWKVLTGLLGGPLLVLAPLLLWGMEYKEGNVTPQQVAQGAIASSRVYLVVSLVALGFWVAIVRIIYEAYGLDVTAMWNALWVNADPCVKFLAVDAIGLFLGALLYIASVDPVDAVAALFLSPGLGPGAACGLMLWGHERVRTEKATAIVNQQKKRN